MRAVDYLLTGAAGQLGRALLATAQARGRSVLATDLDTMPLDDRAAIQRVFGDVRPRAVLHCGAITNVDGCEHDALAAFRINALSTAWVAEAAAAAGASLLYVSSDFVFDGSARVPYAVDAVPRPLSVYGASKRLGEQAVLAHARADFHVVRASWLFGPGGRNFVRAILDRARAGQPLKVVTDQIGRPTWAPDLADALLDLVEARAPGGIWHAANEGQCSWHEFAVEIVRAAGLGNVAVGTQTAAEHAAGLAAAGRSAPAPRPAWSVLDTQKLAALRGRPLPHWRDALRRHLPLDAATPTTESPAAPDQGLRSKQY